MTITMLLNKHGRPVSVYESLSAAQAKCDKYNADPFFAEGEPDSDAPYTIEEWLVMGNGPRVEP